MSFSRDLNAWMAVNPTRKATILGVAVILLVFVGSLWVPVVNETGNRVSPATPQTSVDINFYRATAEILFDRPDEIFQLFLGAYSSEVTSPAVAPPLFPAMLRLFSYGPGNTWAMSVVFLLLGSAFVLIWMALLRRRGLPLVGLAIIAILPQTAWFTISVSSELPFALLIALFFYFYMDADRPRNLVVWIVLLLMVTARTNSLSIVFFYICCLAFADDRPLRARFIETFFLGIAALLLCALYLPSLLGTVEGSFDRFGHFGYPAGDYLGGLYSDLPAILDLPLSWAALFGAKTLYVVGLRPSFGGVDVLTLLVRSSPGLLLLPGLVFLMFYAPRRERFFVFLFLLPIYVGVTQERYLFPIVPLIAFYGLQAYASAWRRLAGLVKDSDSR
jgi:hypothetical protein